MSLGGSQWCRPMSMNSYRSTDHDEDRWTDYSSHRSMSSARSVEPTIGRQREPDVDRHNTLPIDRQAPLTYQVRLPSIYNEYINALRLPPKQLAIPPEPKPNPLNSSPEPVQEEQETDGRRPVGIDLTKSDQFCHRSRLKNFSVLSSSLRSHLVEELYSHPCLAAQYQSMFEVKHRSILGGKCRSTEELLRSMGVGEYRPMKTVSRSTVVGECRSTN
uniref:Uncharacterized protein n=1 Tax=Brassica campestris TaxID=3711 RepID=M4FCV4_BRACM